MKKTCGEDNVQASNQECMSFLVYMIYNYYYITIHYFYQGIMHMTHAIIV